MADLKPSLLVAVTNRNQLGESAKDLWRLLAGVLIYSPLSLSDEELRNVLQSLDKEALASLASSFVHIAHQAEASGRHEIWERGIGRALRLWPLDKQLRSEELSGTLVRLATLLEDDFEAVARVIRALIVPMHDVQMVLYGLGQTTVPEKHPWTVVRLLSSIVDPLGKHPYLDPQTCTLLSRVRAVDPEVASLAEYSALAKTGWFELP